MWVPPWASAWNVLQNMIGLKMGSFPNELTLYCPTTSTLIQQRHVKLKFTQSTEWTECKNLRITAIFNNISSIQQHLEKQATARN